MDKRLKTAFTLIELLVVIAIIGILSGLIIVTMSGVTNSANIAKAQIFSNSLRNALMMNLISEWKFDQVNVPAANQTPDSWGTNTGTLYGAGGSQNLPQLQTTGCVSSNCLKFDGTDDYVNCGSGTSLNITDTITTEAWVKRTGSCGGAGDCDIFIRGDDGVAGYRFTLAQGTAVRFDTFSPTKNVSTSGNIIDVNTWYHVVATKSGTGVGSVKLYLNGVNVTSSQGNHGNPVSNNNNAHIGTYNNSNHFFNGLIDNIRIYNAAMPTSQIKQNYYIGLNNLFKNGGIDVKEYSQRLLNGLSLK